ncbi:hypothetical protein M440DRAFT_170560 [Trichoderma longibrachiatum ATCC 18648]|uniref:Uncharacterized protein n=1 Tax=Trichoderma longibrachiatum ATCC 18648 TaxID=983965 RepID=A0A2T4BRN5_TRILO|nr:hypothetical protein M440DRAFT_170560 [Trichoderma longibrachiatum ATCC 18648]
MFILMSEHFLSIFSCFIFCLWFTELLGGLYLIGGVFGLCVYEMWTKKFLCIVACIYFAGFGETTYSVRFSCYAIGRDNDKQGFSVLVRRGIQRRCWDLGRMGIYLCGR